METCVSKVRFNVVYYASEAHHCQVEWPQQNDMAIATHGSTLHHVAVADCRAVSVHAQGQANHSVDLTS